MKHVYPVRHPPVPAAAARGETTVAGQPSLPHESDESSHSQAQGTEGQKTVGRQALRNATDGTADTDRGPVLDKVYNDKIAPDRGATPPRR
jgi:hypothetical protein